MLVSHAWLRQWVSTPLSVGALAERLTLGGLEVKSVDTAGPRLHKKKVIIGRIIHSDPHPGAPSLTVCEVDIGRRANLTIVCGATNVMVGHKVPVATVGARLPVAAGGASMRVVQARRIKGIESAGMLCSAAELGLEEHSDGVMLLDQDAPLGGSVGDYLDLSDPVLEIELTPNRGDCLSILGVAREVSALSGAKMSKRSSGRRIDQRIDQGATNAGRTRSEARLPIDLQAPAGCPRYVGRAVRNIDMSARTPDWMKERLRRSGARSLNVVVDVTNYVMLELGQPMHAFDMDKLAGGIVVRMARPREKLHLLDGSTVTLNDDNLVIADHQKAVALAGIMGGRNSAISASTRHIYFESAFFPAAAIIGRARKLGMHTDASHRYERGVDATVQADAMQRATDLLVSLAGGEPGPVSDARQRKFLPRPVKIAFERAEIARILGVSVPAQTVSALLKRLGMAITPITRAARPVKRAARRSAKVSGAGETTAAGWNVVVPGWRSDITGPHDLVEEVGRVYGFDKIAPRPPLATATTGGHPEGRIDIIHSKQKLIDRGYFEAITYSFVDPKIQRALLGGGRAGEGIRLRNPIADNLAVMRRSLWPGLLEAVKTNLNRQHERVRLFEAGRVFLPGRKGAREEVHRLAAAASGALLPRQWGAPTREVDFFDIKGDLAALLGVFMRAPVGQPGVEFHPAEHPALHPGRCAQIKLGQERIGYLGQLHPAHHRLLEIDQPVYLFEIDAVVLRRAPLPRFAAVSRYPAVRRDLAVVVDSSVTAQDVLDTARAAADDLLTHLELFDIYAGERVEKNQKSFAFGLTFQSDSSNLTAREVEQKTDQLVKALQRRLGARLRT